MKSARLSSLDKIIIRLKLSLPSHLGDGSYSFKASSELICIAVTVSLLFYQNAVAGSNFPQEQSGIVRNESHMIEWFSNQTCNDTEKSEPFAIGPVHLVDPAEWPEISLLNRGFGSMLSIFLRKSSKTRSSLNFLQSGPRKLTKPDLSGLAPVR